MTENRPTTPLYTAAQIALRVHALAGEVRRDLGADTLTMVCILRGAICFAADLARALGGDLRLRLVSASSYSGTSPAHVPKINAAGLGNLDGHRVLIVDDILDSGRTLSAVLEEVCRRGAQTVRTCVLLQKERKRPVDITADFACFSIPDQFVVGYGMDLDGRHWNLPHISLLE